MVTWILAVCACVRGVCVCVCVCVCASVHVLTRWHTYWWVLPSSIILAVNSVISHQVGGKVTGITNNTPHRCKESTNYSAICDLRWRSTIN